MKTVAVSADALRRVLSALNGPDHYIRELQMIRGLPGSDNPIDKLIADFNAGVELHNAQQTDT